MLRRFPSKEFHLCAAKECLRVPGMLDEMIQDSIGHVAAYENYNEPFHNRGDSGSPTKAKRNSDLLADKFVCRLFEERHQSVDEKSLDFECVDYEVSPFRTTGRAVFENGKSARKPPRLDVLLASRRFPIIGEVKAEDDATLFLALIQSLTYAIEFLSPNQRTRLTMAYPDRFTFSEEGPFADIYLIQVRPLEDEWSGKFLTAVDSLAEKLLNQKSVRNLIRRIVCLKTPYANEQPIQFSIPFCHQVSAVKNAKD